MVAASLSIINHPRTIEVKPMEQKTYGLPELTAEIAKQAEVSKKDAERVI